MLTRKYWWTNDVTIEREYKKVKQHYLEMRNWSFDLQLQRCLYQRRKTGSNATKRSQPNEKNSKLEEKEEKTLQLEKDKKRQILVEKEKDWEVSLELEKMRLVYEERLNM